MRLLANTNSIMILQSLTNKAFQGLHIY